MVFEEDPHDTVRREAQLREVIQRGQRRHMEQRWRAQPGAE
jgi:hypothetical protein